METTAPKTSSGIAGLGLNSTGNSSMGSCACGPRFSWWSRIAHTGPRWKRPTGFAPLGRAQERPHCGRRGGAGHDPVVACGRVLRRRGRSAGWSPRRRCAEPGGQGIDGAKLRGWPTIGGVPIRLSAQCYLERFYRNSALSPWENLTSRTTFRTSPWCLAGRRSLRRHV